MIFSPNLPLALQKLRRASVLAAQITRAVYLLLWGLILAVSTPLSASAADALQAGPLFDEFELTLALGHRTEALGPFFYSEQKETQQTWAVPPLLSYTRNPALESTEFDFLYPVMTYDRYGGQYRWPIFQVVNLSGCP